MIKVYFKKSGQLEALADVDTVDAAYQVMNKDLEEKGINPPYYRSWRHENKQIIDFGSYVNFYEFHFDTDIRPQSICKE